MTRSLLILLPAAVAWAQSPDTALKVPLLGYLVSNSPVSVRPIAGAPGAVVLGGAIGLPAAVTRVHAAPGQQFGIIERSGASESAVLTFSLDGTGSVAAIANTFPQSDQAAFSPSGAVAVLYRTATHQAQVVTGLPGSPQLSRTVDLSAAGLPLVSLAVSDDAQAILAGVSDGTNGAIWSFVAGQSAQQVGSAGVPAALRFFGGKHDAVAADKAYQQVLLLPSGGSPRALAGAVQGIHSPADLEISSDQQTVWVADSSAATSTIVNRRQHVMATGAATGKLFRIDLASGSVDSMDSSVAAAGITRLAGDSVFLLISQDGASAGIWAPADASAVWRLTGASVE